MVKIIGVGELVAPVNVSGGAHFTQRVQVLRRLA